MATTNSKKQKRGITMKKKLLTILLMLTLSANFIACGNSEPEDGASAEISKDQTEESANTNENSEPDTLKPEEEQSDTQSDSKTTNALEENQEDPSTDLNALGNINVDDGIFDVKLTILAEYVGEERRKI